MDGDERDLPPLPRLPLLRDRMSSDISQEINGAINFYEELFRKILNENIEMKLEMTKLQKELNEAKNLLLANSIKLASIDTNATEFPYLHAARSQPPLTQPRPHQPNTQPQPPVQGQAQGQDRTRSRELMLVMTT